MPGPVAASQLGNLDTGRIAISMIDLVTRAPAYGMHVNTSRSHRTLAPPVGVSAGSGSTTTTPLSGC